MSVADQDMARLGRDQGQVDLDGEQEADRDPDGEIQDRGEGDQDQSLQQGGDVHAHLVGHDGDGCVLMCVCKSLGNNWKWKVNQFHLYFPIKILQLKCDEDYLDLDHGCVDDVSDAECRG